MAMSTLGPNTQLGITPLVSPPDASLLTAASLPDTQFSFNSETRVPDTQVPPAYHSDLYTHFDPLLGGSNATSPSGPAYITIAQTPGEDPPATQPDAPSDLVTLDTATAPPNPSTMSFSDEKMIAMIEGWQKYHASQFTDLERHKVAIRRNQGGGPSYQSIPRTLSNPARNDNTSMVGAVLSALDPTIRNVTCCHQVLTTAAAGIGMLQFGGRVASMAASSALPAITTAASTVASLASSVGPSFASAVAPFTALL